MGGKKNLFNFSIESSNIFIYFGLSIELLSGVDYRDQVCYAAAPAAIDHQTQLTAIAAAAAATQQQTAPLPAAATTPVLQASPPLIAPSIHPATPPVPTTGSVPAAPVTDMLLRGIQSPFAGLAKLFNQYNLFG